MLTPKNIKEYNFLVFTFGIVIAIAFFFGFYTICSAEIFYDVIQDVNEGNFAREWIGSNFTPTEAPITGVEVYAEQNTGVELYICYGNIDNAEEASTTPRCELDVLLASSTCQLTGGATSTCYLDRTHTTVPGQEYYFTLIRISGGSGGNYWSGFTLLNEYEDGELFGYQDGIGYYYSGYDMTFRTFFDNNPKYDPDNPDVEIIELPDWTGTISVESEYELQFNYENYCTIGQTCRIWVNYNREVVGHEIYLIDSTQSGFCDYDLDSAVDSFEPIDGILLQDYFNIPATSSAITDYYCIYDQNPDDEGIGDDVIYQGISLTWQFESTILDDIFEDWDCDTICDDIATGTDWFNFKYGVECGTRKVLCWGFRPSDESIISFGRSVYTIKNAFPFSVLNQIEDEIKEIDLTKASTTIPFKPATFGLPSNNEYVLASSTTMSKVFGEAWDDKIYPGMEILVYLLGFLYLVRKIFILSKAKKEIE